MSPLVYLTVKKAKNKFMELLHKPLKLIVAVAFLILIALNFTASSVSLSGDRPIVEFKAIVMFFYLVCFITEVKKGFQSGGTMFSMADVNLVFMSPLKSVFVLLHGMLSRFGSSLFMGVAFVYQFALLRSYYPIKVSDMLIAIAGYGVVVFVSQLAGMLVYFFTCGEQSRIKSAKLVIYSVCLIFAFFAAVNFVFNRAFTFTGFADALTSLSMHLFPVAGWIFTFVEGFMLSNVLLIISGVFPTVLFAVAVFAVFVNAKQGYYEDVLLSAEKVADRKADSGLEVTKVRRNAGILKGKGASALFFKNMLENRRTKTGIFSPGTLLYSVLICVYGFALKSDFIILFSFSCMVSFLPVLGGRWLKELAMPHVYLIPESPLKKLFFIVAEMFPKIVVESVLHCILIGYICKLSFATAAVLVIARMSVSFVLVGTALLAARIFREKEKNSIFLASSVLPGILFTLPAVFACIGVLNFGMGAIFAFAVMSAVNVAVSVLLLFFARNLLKINE